MALGNTTSKMTTDFQKVILAHDFSNILVGQGLREGLVISEDRQYLESPFFRRLFRRQYVLSLLVLFDKLLIPHIWPQDNPTVRIPILEDAGVLERVDTPEIHKNSSVGWDPLRPFIVDELVRIGSKKKDDLILWKQLAKTLGWSRRKTYGAAIDYVGAISNEDVRKQTAFYRLLPKSFLTKLDEQITRPFSLKKGPFNECQFLLLVAVGISHFLELYQECSMVFGAGVASTKWSAVANTTSLSVNDPTRDIANTFGLVRAELSEEQPLFPRFESIKDALMLRRDANFKAFRKQLALFHDSISRGEKEDAIRIRKEVSKAKRRLKAVQVLNQPLRFVTYLSLPTSIIEPLIFGPPIVGTSLSILSVTATMTLEHIKRKNAWVLFGSS
jgi:hypothetical protein